MSGLTASVQHDLARDVSTATFAGDLTLTSVPIVRSTVLKAMADCPSAILVDLREVRVSSPVALTVLPAVAQRRDFLPDVSVLVCLSPEAMTGPRERAALGDLPVYSSASAALGAAAEARRHMLQTAFSSPVDLRAPGNARRMVRDICAQWGIAQLTHIAQLVVSELVTNAIRHAGTDIDVELLLRGDFLHLRVHDRSTAAPRRHAETVAANAARTGGRGLHLIDVYASGWGHVVGTGGKVVWATLRARPIGGP